jgi:outer membrane protein
MTFLKRAAAVLLATTALAAVATPSIAQDFKGKSGGDILVRLRGLAVLPDDKAPVTTASGASVGNGYVGNDYIPELDLNYFFTENLAAELILGTSKHKVTAAVPGIGNIDVGSVRLLPPTLTLQYHLFPKSRVSPYVGAGLNYTLFYDKKNSGPLVPGNTNYKNAFGVALQAGVDVAVSGPWSINFDVKKIFLKTDLTVDATTFPGAALQSRVRLDPWLVGFGVGYRF